jgi:hypothetical protein
LIAASSFESPRNNIVFNASRDFYLFTVVLNLARSEYDVSQFAPGRQIFCSDCAHPFFNLPLEIGSCAKCGNDMKSPYFVQKRLFMSFTVRG